MEIYNDKNILIDKKFYDNLNTLALYNRKKQIMIVGGKIDGDKVVIDQKSFKWFTKDEFEFKDVNKEIIPESVLTTAMLDVASLGNDAVILLQTHTCKNDYDDFLYGSLSDTDLINSKKLYLLCSFKNYKFFDGVITGKHIYFWSIDNEYLKPIQVDCYVDGEKVNVKVPTTMQELINSVLEGRE